MGLGLGLGLGLGAAPHPCNLRLQIAIELLRASEPLQCLHELWPQPVTVGGRAVTVGGRGCHRRWQRLSAVSVGWVGPATHMHMHVCMHMCKRLRPEARGVT